MTMLDRKRLESAHDLPLHRDHLNLASAHILSVAVLGSDTQQEDLPFSVINCGRYGHFAAHASHKII